MDLSRIFARVSDRMKLDFEEARDALSHPGQKGGANENIVRTFLRKYLPASIGISEGVLVDRYGNLSRQLDVILFDDRKTPVFFVSGDTRVIPIECAYAVVEVKARLDIAEFEKCVENMNSVRSLQDECYSFIRGPISETKNMYGSEWGYWPTNYFVFAFDSPHAQGIFSHIAGHSVNKNPPHKRIDAIIVLNKFVICNAEPNDLVNVAPLPKIVSLPTHTSMLAFVDNGKRSLMIFYGLLSNLLNQASMPNFNMVPYINSALVERETE